LPLWLKALEVRRNDIESLRGVVESYEDAVAAGWVSWLSRLEHARAPMAAMMVKTLK
jgi:hypothetical protein